MDEGLIGPKRRFAPVKAWFSSWATGTPSVYPLIVVGDTGVGKSTVVRHYASEAGFDTIESHGEDERDAKSLGRLFGDARMPTFFGQRRAVIIEDPGLFDKRTWRSIEEPVKHKAFPLILICTNEGDVPWPIRRGGLVHRLDGPSPDELVTYLRRLDPGRGESELRSIVRSCSSFRAAALRLATTEQESSEVIDDENRTRYGHDEVAAILRGDHQIPDFSAHPLALITAAEFNGASPEAVIQAMLIHSRSWEVEGLSEVARAYLATLRAPTQDRPPFRRREVRGATRQV